MRLLEEPGEPKERVDIGRPTRIFGALASMVLLHMTMAMVGADGSLLYLYSIYIDERAQRRPLHAYRFYEYRKSFLVGDLRLLTRSPDVLLELSFVFLAVASYRTMLTSATHGDLLVQLPPRL